MNIPYNCYSDFIDCKNGDKVYVYHKNIFDKNNEINKSMFGTIISFNQFKDEDWICSEYLHYEAIIELPNGKKIKIDAETNFFRKYEFITLKDLKTVCNQNNIIKYDNLLVS